MKRTGLVFILCLLLATTALAQTPDKDVVFQVSTLSALQEGVYDGHLTLEELKAHGDFGIGTYEGLDGEMIVLDNQVYQVKADGKVYRPEAGVKTPFAAVTFFENDKKAPILQEMDTKHLQDFIVAFLPTQNIPYAFKINGFFKYVKTRSVPKQSKPYPRLADVTQYQPTFEMRDIKGTIIGFWFPNYLGGANMAGFHLHFLSEDKNAGGHLLECRISAGDLAIDDCYGFNLSLPAQSDFFKTDLSKDTRKELENIEK